MTPERRYRLDFAQRLLDLRTRLGKDKALMSLMAGASPNSWGNWESGRNLPSIEAIRYLKTSIPALDLEWLIGVKGGDEGR